jgi:16S rRNA (cytidine1402-2'-O)-methyltransferase
MVTHFGTSDLNTSYTLALQAAETACGQQNYPTAALYMVATPIGNLADISLRALAVLQRVDAIACEDTRHTGQMLRVYGLAAGSERPLLALHQHNEASAAQDVLARLAAGQRVAYVSDAGTPAISDPGAKLVQQVQRAGYRVVPLPGASSATAALSVAGVVQDGGYLFRGFLPHGANDRKLALQQAFEAHKAVILFEAPHRIGALAKELAQWPDRTLTVARELTKQFEHIQTLTTSAWLEALTQDPNGSRGEFVVILHPAPTADKEEVADTRVLSLLLKELPLKTAVKLAADITGQQRNTLYAAALAFKQAKQQDLSPPQNELP